MAATSRNRSGRFARGIGVRQVRLVSGVILFAYLVSHFLNHALGNISMDALAAGITGTWLFWQFLPIAALFYGRMHRPHRARHLGALSAAAIPLEDDRDHAARARPFGSADRDLPYRRRAARAGSLRARKTLSAGILPVLRQLAAEGVADARGAGDRLGARLHRALFLAAHEGVLQARSALPARRRRADADAGRCSASIRAAAAVVADSDEYDWRVNNLSVRQVGTKAEAAALDRIAEYSLLFYLGLVGCCAAGARRARR